MNAQQIGGLAIVLAAAAAVAVFGTPKSKPDQAAPTVTTPVSVAESPPAEAPAAASAKDHKCFCGPTCTCKGECLCKEPLACNPIMKPLTLRRLTNDEVLSVMVQHEVEWAAWVNAHPDYGDHLTIRELIERWLAEVPQHDPRLATGPELRELTSDELAELLKKHTDSWQAWVITQPNDVPRPKQQLVQLWLLENPQFDPRLTKPCPVCKGHGTVTRVDRAGKPLLTLCATCGGDGKITKPEFKATPPSPVAEPKLTRPEQTCTVCNGAGATRVNDAWLKCSICGGDGTIDDDPRDPEAQPGFKQTRTLYTHPQEPKPAAEYVTVQQTRYVSRGILRRRSYPETVQVRMLRSEYEAQQAANKAQAAQPRTYYRYYGGNCANGSCR